MNLFFQLVSIHQLRKLILEIFSQQLENRSRLGIGANSIKSPEIYLNEMRLIKSEFEIKRMREAIQISAEAHELVRESISSKKMKDKFRVF